MIKSLKYALMKKSREKKYQQFLLSTKPSKESNLLDVGVSDQEYSPVDNYLEKRYLYPKNITALSINTLNKFRKRYPQIKSVSYQGEFFPSGLTKREITRMRVGVDVPVPEQHV